MMQPFQLRSFILLAPLVACAAPAAQTRAPDCAIAAPSGVREQLDCAIATAIDAASREAIAAGQSPGLGVAVVRDGRIVFNRSYGMANLELAAPVTPETVFRIYSVTKTFVAAAVMQLAESGRLNLDDRISLHYPNFPRGGEVTITRLMNHTSGIRDFVNRSIQGNFFTTDQIIDHIARQENLYGFDPGMRRAYSNSNYVLLAGIIERVTGLDYEQYLAQNVFSRADMPRTAVDRNTEIVPSRASGYVLDTDRPGRFLNGPHIDASVPSAAGAMRSTPADLANWFTAFFAGRVVSPESLRAMIPPGRLNDGSPAINAGSNYYYGLGLESNVTDGHRWIGHEGGFTSFNATVNYYVDDGFMVIVLSNICCAAAELEPRIARIMLAAGDHQSQSAMNAGWRRVGTR